MPKHEGGGYEQNVRLQERMKAWLDRLEEIEHVRDALGFPIDNNIRETIVALNLSGMPTSASCEGHTDRARGAPWIKIEALGRPRERYVGEDGIVETTAEKYHVSMDDVRRSRNVEAWEEASNLAANNGETPEYQAWRMKNDILRDRLIMLLEEFYRGRSAEGATHLELSHDPEGTWKLHNGGEDFQRSSRAFSDEERHDLSERLARYQSEMTAFTDFLRDKYYSSQ